MYDVIRIEVMTRDLEWGDESITRTLLSRERREGRDSLVMNRRDLDRE